MAISDTLTEQVGPLPGWAWALGGIAGVGGILYYRNKKKAAAAAQAQAASAAADSSNLGTVPVSNLTQQAQPMPIQLGDTFVNTGTPSGTPQVTSTGNPVTTVLSPSAVQPPSDNLQPAGVPNGPAGPVPSGPASGGQSPGTG